LAGVGDIGDILITLTGHIIQAGVDMAGTILIHITATTLAITTMTHIMDITVTIMDMVTAMDIKPETITFQD